MRVCMFRGMGRLLWLRERMAHYCWYNRYVYGGCCSCCGGPTNNMARRDVNKLLETPAYPFVEAAHYLNIPLSTLRAWCLGQGYRSDGKTRRFQPIIRLDGNDRRALS